LPIFLILSFVTWVLPNSGFAFGAVPGAWAQLPSFQSNPTAAANLSAGNVESDRESEFKQIRFRASWTGERPTSWKGQIYLSDGEVLDSSPLGIENDSPVTTLVSEGRIHLLPGNATVYGGIDFRARTRAEGFVFFDLQNEISGQRFSKAIPVKELLESPKRQAMDQSQNILHVMRSPGDEIRIDWKQSTAVFECEEVFSPEIEVWHPGLQANTEYNFNFSIYDSGTGNQVWQQRIANRTNGHAEFERIRSPSSRLPEEEGVYEYRVEVSSTRSFSRFRLNRNIQFIVLSKDLPARRDPSSVASQQNSGEMWQRIAQYRFDDQRKSSFDQLNFLSSNDRRLGNRKTSLASFGKRKYTEISPGGWEAVKVDFVDNSKPHILEIEYPNHEMSVGVSILQKNDLGQVDLLGMDSGFVVENVSSEKDLVDTGTHRVVIWPSDKDVYVLVANRHRQKSCLIGNINLYAGPNSLSPAAATDVDRLANRRDVMAFFERPFFSENFNVSKTLDPNRQHAFTDWQFFYKGANRLIQHLKANGYTGAMITVAADGSSLYPSIHLRPNPKFDSGIFFSDARDAKRKDVVEMLMRLFAREELKLVPVVEFNSKLPNLETRRFMQTASTSMVLNDMNGRARNGIRRGGQAKGENSPSLPGYNILDPVVQQEIRARVVEIRDRYRSHDSFGGVTIKLSPETFALLPGGRWGYDQKTVARFLNRSENGSATENIGEKLIIDLPSTVARLRQGDLKEEWRKWRRDTITGFYSSLAKDIVSKQNHRKLYLAMVEVWRTPDLRSALTPDLQGINRFDTALEELGLDIHSIDKIPGVMLLKPNRVTTSRATNEERVEYSYAHSRDRSEIESSLVQAGDLFVSRNDWVHFAQLERFAPFASHKGSLIRLQPLSHAGWKNRERFALALKHQDSQVLVDGGIVLSMGQSAALDSWSDVFRSLPLARFNDVPSQENSPAIVRQANVGGQRFFYAVNTSPWSVELKIEFDSQVKLESLSNRFFDQTLNEQNGNSVATIRLEAFDIVASKIVVSKIAAETVDSNDTRARRQGEIVAFATVVPERVAESLHAEIGRLKQRMSRLDLVEPLTSLVNSGFESKATSAQERELAAGWTADPNRKLDFSTMTGGAAEGQTYLEMSSRGNVLWMRSNEFPVPETGRLTVIVWLKSDDGTNPPLRISIDDGENGSQQFYRFAKIGDISGDSNATSTGTNQINSEWKKFVVHFNDLPQLDGAMIRVGFDLMGQGTVAIDQVEVHDRWFDENDRRALTQFLAAASFQLSRNKDHVECRRILSNYWLSFLRTYVQPSSPDTTSNEN